MEMHTFFLTVPLPVDLHGIDDPIPLHRIKAALVHKWGSGGHSINYVAQQMGIAVSTAHHYLEQAMTLGLPPLRHVGALRNGHWEVVR